MPTRLTLFLGLTLYALGLGRFNSHPSDLLSLLITLGGSALIALTLPLNKRSR